MYKTARQLERHLKGVSCHRRIEILELVSKNPEISLEDISRELGVNQKTTSEHTKRLEQAGLISKKYRGRYIGHKATPYGTKIYRFLESFQ